MQVTSQVVGGFVVIDASASEDKEVVVFSAISFSSGCFEASLMYVSAYSTRVDVARRAYQPMPYSLFLFLAILTVHYS